VSDHNPRGGESQARGTAGTLSISYRIVALGSGLLAAGCLTTLIVVSALNDADALASTAMALAIITFIVQLIVYVAQAEQARRDNVLAQQLHKELSASLADLTARAHGTESLVESMNEKLLDKALRIAETEGRDAVPAEFTRGLAQNFSGGRSPQSGAFDDTADESPFPIKTWGPDEDERILARLLRWPSDQEEEETFRGHIEGLTDEAAFMLRQFATDEAANRNPNSELAPSWFASPDGYAEELFDRGLIENFRGGVFANTLAHLTDAGRDAARAFTASGLPPEGLRDLVDEVREAANRWGNQTTPDGTPPPRQHGGEWDRNL
jgi:hypothetical protein